MNSDQQQSLAVKLQKTQEQANKAIYLHSLAMQAFSVACARHDWALAEKEQASAADQLDVYMCSMMSIHRIVQELNP